MEELLKKLRQLANNPVIKKHCQDKVKMNACSMQLQFPYISYNPVISSNGLVDCPIPGAEQTFIRYTSQINLYVKSGYNFYELYHAIKDTMKEQGFRLTGEFMNATDSGIDQWICFRYTITI